MKPLNDDFRINGERLYLRPITVDDIDMLLKWRNAPYVSDNFFYRKPISHSEQEAWINNKVKGGEVFQFIVCLNDDTPVGCVYLQHYDSASNSMESGVFMSEEAPRGVGIATEAVSVMNYDFAFKYLNLSTTFARVIDTNIGSLRLHEKAGFIKTKEEECEIIPDGYYVNSIEFELKNPENKQ